jgi:hypothetical protein
MVCNGPTCTLRLVCALMDMFEAQLPPRDPVEASSICTNVVIRLVICLARSVGNGTISIFNDILVVRH